MGFASFVLLLKNGVVIVHEINGVLPSSDTWRVISRVLGLIGYTIHGGMATGLEVG
jgi:hypothetical protein